MKTKFRIPVLFFVTAFLGTVLAVSCSDDEKTTPPAETATLKTTITTANTLLAASVEGSGEGQFPTGSKAALQSAVTAAQAVADNTASTQTIVDNANVSLTAAITSFQGLVVAAIAPESLIAQWKLDEGTGTVAGDASANKLNGTLMAGHPSLGGGIPTWAADRKGVAAKALHFTNGGHIEVPANAKFGPTELTISVWVKLDSLNTTDCSKFKDRCSNGTFKDNYIISQNSYNGYKLQTQDDKYPFMTVKKATNPDGYIDQAASQNLPLKQWHHVAVTFKNSEMKFYVDGTDVTKTDGGQVFTGTFITLEERFDFVIGQEVPNAKVPSDISWVLPHFEGSMDEIRMYSKVLTGTQVLGIYNQEK